MFKGKLLAVTALFALAGAAQAAVPILFNPNGGGSTGAISVTTFDWLPSSALVVGGNPSGGLTSAQATSVRTHAKLAAMVQPGPVIIPVPDGIEITYVTGYEQTSAPVIPGVVSSTINFAPNKPNFFEMWVSTRDSNDLAGTGFNNTRRILYGQVTNAFSLYQASAAPPDKLDLFLADNYPGILTIQGGGSTQISVQVISLDPDYFPGFTSTQIATLKSQFNTANNTPFLQVNPSARFTDEDAGANALSPPGANVLANIGIVNGGLQNGSNLNFIAQADANQSFEPGVEVPGACRVTYGGNDRNGNIDLAKFGTACSSVKGNTENCYTFGGQVGAPTADPAQGGPFGEHTHHQVSGPAGDFVFRAGTRSAPKTTRITATACKDPGACRQAEANAGFKQIDFEGTGSFRTLSATAQAYLITGGDPVQPDHLDARTYYFRVDMDDLGEPGNKQAKGPAARTLAETFLGLDLNNTLATPDPLLPNAQCNQLADLYQFYICPTASPCESAQAMYAVRGYLTGGNIQLHKIIK